MLSPSLNHLPSSMRNHPLQRRNHILGKQRITLLNHQIKNMLNLLSNHHLRLNAQGLQLFMRLNRQFIIHKHIGLSMQKVRRRPPLAELRRRIHLCIIPVRHNSRQRRPVLNLLDKPRAARIRESRFPLNHHRQRRKDLRTLMDLINETCILIRDLREPGKRPRVALIRHADYAVEIDNGFGRIGT